MDISYNKGQGIFTVKMSKSEYDIFRRAMFDVLYKKIDVESTIEASSMCKDLLNFGDIEV